MPKRDRDMQSEDPNAGYPGITNPDGTLAPKQPAGPTVNEPDGDASGRPGSATMAKPASAGEAADESEKLAPGQVRVKAKKTVLHGGMAYHEGQTFVMDEQEFNHRKDRDELERA